MSALVLLQEKEVYPFHNINVHWLEDFQKWMLEENYAETSVAIYLRHLRAVINRAIVDKIIQPELYPFCKAKGDGKFVIQPGSSKPRALNNDQLKKLMNVHGLSPDQEKAKAFWFFSFASNGMNTKDIALLKWVNFKEDYFTFKRSKIKKTSKKSKAITVYLKPFHYDVMEKYGTKIDEQNEYVFPVIKSGMTAIEQDWRINNFIRSINQNIKKVAKKAGLDLPLSSVWARHSYATKAMNQEGADPLVLMRTLGHTQFSTRENYLHNLNDKPYRQMQSSVLDDLLTTPIKKSKTSKSKIP